MEQRFDYPPIDTLEITAMDLALLNELFGVANSVAKHPELISDNMELAMHVGLFMALGRQCGKFTKDLRERQQSHDGDCHQARIDVAPQAAEITAHLMIVSQIIKCNPDTKAKFEQVMQTIDNMTPEQVQKAAEKFGC